MAEASPIQLKRHCHELSPAEIDELVVVVADLIVDFLKKRPETGQAEEEVPA